MRSRNVLTSIVLAVLPLVSGSLLLQGQAPDQTGGKKVFGYQDAQTGVFHPLPLDIADPNATTPTTGTLKVVLNITVKSSWPAAL